MLDLSLDPPSSQLIYPFCLRMLPNRPTHDQEANILRNLWAFWIRLTC